MQERHGLPSRAEGRLPLVQDRRLNLTHRLGRPGRRHPGAHPRPPIAATPSGRRAAFTSWAVPASTALLITGGPIDDQVTERVVELILRGFSPPTKFSKLEEGNKMKIHAIKPGPSPSRRSSGKASGMAGYDS
jgi:hypothetical protein